MEHTDGFTSEERSKLRAMMVDHARIMNTVFGDGNGTRGLLWQINDHLSRDDERENTRAMTDKRRSRIHFALLTALLALVTGCAVIVFQMWAAGHEVVSTGKPVSQLQRAPVDANAGPTHF